MNFQFLYLYFILNYFLVFFAKIRCELSEIPVKTMLFIGVFRLNHCGRHLGKLIGHNSTYVLSRWRTFRHFFLLLMDGFSKIKLQMNSLKFGSHIRLWYLLPKYHFMLHDESPLKKSAHFLSNLSPTLNICRTVTSPHTCGCDVTRLGLRRVLPWRSTAVTMTWRQSNITSTSHDVCVFATSLDNVL